MGDEESPVKGDISSHDLITSSTPLKEDACHEESRDGGESRSSLTPSRELPAEARIPALLNRTIPGSCTPENRGSLNWGPDGCLAYGAGSLVVVVEAGSAQHLQVLNHHRHPVTRTAWSAADDRKLCLASADTGGNIIYWNVIKGEPQKQFQDENLPVADLKWLDGRIEKTSALLLSIHPPNHLILWNTNTGAKVWKKSYNEAIYGLELDPFNCMRLMFLSQNCVLFIDDFHPEKQPKSEGKKFFIVGGKSGSPARASYTEVSTTEDKSTKGTKLSKIMRQMVLGETRQSQHSLDTATECLSASFHRGVKDLILLAFPKEVMLVDLRLSQALGTINLERAHSSLAGIRTCSERDLIYVLHESGSISVWRKKPSLSVLATPSMSRSQSMVGLGSGRASFSSTTLPDDGFDLASSDVLLEIAYESKVQSDHVRMGKNCKILGLAVHPASEDQISFLTSDGRVYVLSYLERRVCDDKDEFLALPRQEQEEDLMSPKLVIRSILGSSSSSLSVVRMCPALTLKNCLVYSPLLAAGSTSGNILIYNVATGNLEREIAVHTGEVRELEWTSNNPAQSCISCSYHTLTGSNLVRNELIHTDIFTGKTRTLRTDRGEESKITMIRVSHAKLYFVLAFTSGPFELWDVKKLCLLRTMPKKFPLVTALVWSPNHRSKKKSQQDQSDQQTKGGDLPDTTGALSKLEDGMPLKEHILFTDTDSQLYHFSVEGHSIRDGSRIPAETGIGTINAIACKAELIVRGDSDGNINIWNIKARQSKNIHTGRGNIKQLRFAPGRGNLKVLVLYNDGVAIWDVKELEIINELRCRRDLTEVMGVDWVASDRVLLLCTDGSIRVMGLALAGASSSSLLYPRDQPLSCASVLPRRTFSKLAFNSTFPLVHTDLTEESEWTSEQPEYNILQSYQLLHLNSNLSYVERNLEFAHLFGFLFEKKFWKLVYYNEIQRKLSESYDILCDRESYVAREEVKSKLHLNRATDKRFRSAVTSRLLCLGLLEPAVKLLLETDPAEETFLSDQLLACLVSTTSNAVDVNHLSTTKMVATKLIAEGKLWEGVQLLCLVNKVWDACTYLRASKHWEESLWLAKCRLGDQEYIEITKKYSDNLLSQGRIQDAALLHASTGNWAACLEVLHLGQYRSLAARLLHHISATIEPVLSEAIWLEAARFLFEVEHKKGADFFCDKIGDKGKELKEEFYHVK